MQVAPPGTGDFLCAGFSPSSLFLYNHWESALSSGMALDMLGAVGTSRSEQAGCVSSCHWLPWGSNEVQVEPRQHVQPGRSGPEEECVCLVLLSSERSCPQLACSPECAWERGSEARPGRGEGSGLSSENSSFGSEVAFISRRKGTGNQGRVEQERNVFIVEPSRRAWVSILRWNLSNFSTLLVAVLRFFPPVLYSKPHSC